MMLINWRFQSKGTTAVLCSSVYSFINVYKFSITLYTENGLAFTVEVGNCDAKLSLYRSFKKLLSTEAWFSPTLGRYAIALPTVHCTFIPLKPRCWTDHFIRVNERHEFKCFFLYNRTCEGHTHTHTKWRTVICFHTFLYIFKSREWRSSLRSLKER